jgi:hypothetical protein
LSHIILAYGTSEGRAGREHPPPVWMERAESSARYRLIEVSPMRAPNRRAPRARRRILDRRREEAMQSIVAFAASVWDGSPQIARGFAVLVAGWLCAILARTFVRGVLVLFRFDRFADKIGLGEFLIKGKVAYRPSKLVAVLVYWIVVVAALLAASRVLDIAAVNKISDSLVESLPAIFAALLVTFVGLVIIAFLGNVIETIARNAAVSDARAVARVFRYIGYAISILLASDQLVFGKSLLSSLLLIAFAAPALAFAIAFGFGSVDLARDAMQDLLKNLGKRRRGDRDSDLEG